MICDFHIHSNFSDGQMSIPEIVDLYGPLGFGAIAITDHICESQTFLGRAAHHLDRSLTPASFPIYQGILQSETERAWNMYQMVLIPGFEITKNYTSNKRSAHIIGLGVREFISADGKVEDICQSIRDAGGLTVAAHPVDTRVMEKQTLYLWDRRELLRNHFDAWEVASGRHLFEAVQMSGLPMIANSDLHRREQISSWKSILTCEKDEQAIKKAIKNQAIAFSFFEVGK